MLKGKFEFAFDLEGFRIRIEQNGSDFSCFVDGTNFKSLAE